MNTKIKCLTGHFLWLLVGLALMLALACCSSRRLARETPENEIVFQYVDPLIKVFRETAVFPKQEARADEARGLRATFQFAIRSNRQLNNLRVSVGDLHSNSGGLNAAEVGYIGYVHVGRTARTPSHDRLYPISEYYPDPILEKPPTMLRAGLTQPVWIKIPIPIDAVPGTYEGKVLLTASAEGQLIRIERSITVQVYPPVVKHTRLWVTNWWRSSQLSYMNGGKPVEQFSARYWELVRSLAHTMAEYRQNVALISPRDLAKYKIMNGKYEIDFSRFDRMVELFIKEGVIGRIEGGHLAWRSTSEWTSPIAVIVPVEQGDAIVFKKFPITDEKARSFLTQFIPALVAHLKEKGWYDNYMQHIADEPVEANADSYLAIARFVKKLAPDIRIIDASLEGHFLDGAIDIWVPTLQALDEKYEFYKKRPQAGNELWFYTCVVPQGEYANRFIELPLIKTRLLHWINFRYGATGYLHWGFNLWAGSDYRDLGGGDPFEEVSVRGLPGGDPWIVYPKEGGVLPSIRLEAMRDGIEDYELLKMLEAWNPKAAQELVRDVVYDFKTYDINVATFRQTRRRLLELLSETWATEMR